MGIILSNSIRFAVRAVSHGWDGLFLTKAVLGGNELRRGCGYVECPRCHHLIVPGILFCPECEAPLKVIWEETNPLGSAVWEYDGQDDQIETDNEQPLPDPKGAEEDSQKPSLPVTRDIRPRP